MGSPLRAGGRGARRRLREAGAKAQDHPLKTRFEALSQSDVLRIHDAALNILETIGMAAPTERVRHACIKAGCLESASGRLIFPRMVVEECLARAAKTFTVHGRDPAQDFEARSGEIHFCTGGAAVAMLDPSTRDYRPSTLADLFDLARIGQHLGNIQWFARPVVATDIADELDLDINTIYACAAGTSKHIATSFVKGDHVHQALPMLDALAGGSFRDRPFCTVHATTVVSPLSFAPDSLDVACAAVDVGMPVHVQTGPQAGATAPATLAGTLAQVCAEGLASLSVINILKPGHPVVLGNWAFTSDLRTGAFSGGGGEAALLGAASGQMSAFYGVPGGMGAGMSDSKLPDNQAGFEKALTVAVAALSGAGFVFESAGMLASLLGCSHEAMVIDDEMLSVIRRIGRGIEVTDDTLALDVIADAVAGPGHFLGAEQTLKVMETEFVYPSLADRASPDDWAAAGGADIRERAARKARDILAAAPPTLIAHDVDAEIRSNYRIHLPKVDQS